MQIFCGDSHSRQFRTDLPGIYSFNIFTGATLKGLVNDASVTQHGPIIRNLARTPVKSNLILMFGGVDYDFTYYRNLCADIKFSREELIEDCSKSYNSFIERLFNDDRPTRFLSSVIVLAPQATPLSDHVFYESTSLNAKIAEEELRRVAESVDLSHEARNRRVIQNNDYLEHQMISHERVRFYRIDRDMVDENGKFIEKFYARNRRDHHANKLETLGLWAEKLQPHIPKFSKLLNRERRSALLLK